MQNSIETDGNLCTELGPPVIVPQSLTAKTSFRFRKVQSFSINIELY